MNYHHAYHAGNFADLFKHITLMAIINALQSKDNGFCYLDTHAGIGRYFLDSVEARKTKEYEQGIAKIIKNRERKPDPINQYLKLVRSFNPDGVLRTYPGSPLIVRSLLRPQDRMILSELHPEDHQILKNEFRHDSQVAIHLHDGYQSLKAFLPPTPKRGLVLIDPPYEKPDEFGTIIKNLSMALNRWSTGIYMIWYPIKNRRQIDNFERQLQIHNIHPRLHAELNLYPDDSPLSLNGSGLIIVNPPWQLDKTLAQVLPWLLEQLDPGGRGRFDLRSGGRR